MNTIELFRGTLPCHCDAWIESSLVHFVNRRRGRNISLLLLKWRIHGARATKSNFPMCDQLRFTIRNSSTSFPSWVETSLCKGKKIQELKDEKKEGMNVANCNPSETSVYVCDARHQLSSNSPSIHTEMLDYPRPNIQQINSKKFYDLYLKIIDVWKYLPY